MQYVDATPLDPSEAVRHQSLYGLSAAVSTDAEAMSKETMSVLVKVFEQAISQHGLYMNDLTGDNARHRRNLARALVSQQALFIPDKSKGSFANQFYRAMEGVVYGYVEKHRKSS